MRPGAAVASPALTVLNYPSNPTGAVEAPGTFEAAVAFAHERGTWLLNDMAYGFLAFDGHRARSILEVDGARDVAIELWSASKIYGMAGWRVGFAVGSPSLIARIQTLMDHIAAGVWTGVQRGLAVALRSDQADVAERRTIYRARRDLLVDTLTAAGAPPAPAQGIVLRLVAAARGPHGGAADRARRASASRPARGSAPRARAGCGSRSRQPTATSPRPPSAWRRPPNKGRKAGFPHVNAQRVRFRCMAEATVLVVDDDAGFRAYVRAVLEREQFRVVEGESGAEAVDVALRERPDAILLDWRMPGYSGISACRDLRAEPALTGVRIAVITGLDDERDRTLARHAGADAFYIKDPDPDALTGQVRRLLAADGASTAP